MSDPVISADGHIDLPCLPPTLFTENAPRHLRDRMPRVEESSQGHHWVTAQRVRLGWVGGLGSAGHRYEPGRSRRADRMASTGLFEDQARGVMRPALPERRIADQDLDGVVGEVIYGGLGAASLLDDREVADAIVRIYNAFASEFARGAPERFAMIGGLPGGTPAAAALEVRRCAELGLRGVELPLVDDRLPLWREAWDPLWAAAEQCGLPVHLRMPAGGADLRTVQRREDVLPWLATRRSALPLGLAPHVAALLFGGALERFPGLRVVLGGSGLGWIPHLLERMDAEWEERFREPPLRRCPSEYWARQMYATFGRDRVGIALLERVGAERVMWGSSYPHPDGLWPDSRRDLDADLGRLPPPVRRRIVYDNAAELYGFPAAEGS